MDIFGVGFGIIKVAIVIAAAWFIHRQMFRRLNEQPGNHYRGQILLLAVSLLTLILIIVVLPISDTLRGQLLSLTGILISAMIALSSATVVSNLMAGAMLRIIKACRPGDYVQIGEYFGRVSEMDILHCEIQTEERDLLTLPNLHMVTNPLKVLRSSGTLVTVSLSLGYDISRKVIEKQLLIAAEKAGLEKPFVQITDLGDYSVTYRISGLLTNLSKILSTRRLLRACVLDQLHDSGIEIVSPTFMNQRQYENEYKFMPARTYGPQTEVAAAIPDDVVFDKAAKAESLEALRGRLDEINEKIKSVETRRKEAESDEVKAELAERIERLTEQGKRWRQVIQLREERFSEED